MCLDFYFFNSFTIEGQGEGVQIYVLFSPSFDMWKEEGKGPCFFSNFFFSLLSG